MLKLMDKKIFTIFLLIFVNCLLVDDLYKMSSLIFPGISFQTLEWHIKHHFLVNKSERLNVKLFNNRSSKQDFKVKTHFQTAYEHNDLNSDLVLFDSGLSTAMSTFERKLIILVPLEAKHQEF